MAEELARLREELRAEEEAKERLQLQAALDSLRAEQAKLRASQKEEEEGEKKKPMSQQPKAGLSRRQEGEAGFTQPKKKSKTEETRRVQTARSALASLPTRSAVGISVPATKGGEKGTATETEGTTSGTTSGTSQPNPVPREKKWAPLVKATMDHPKFKENSTKCGLATAAGWARAKKCGEWCRKFPHAYALDCEMCVCEDPVTKKRSTRELVRMSVVDASDFAQSALAAEKASSDDVVVDTLVQPSLPVVDYVTRIHGIDAEALEGVEFTRRHAQEALQLLCCDRTVLVGHAVHNDLAALEFRHECLVDTSVLFGVQQAPNGTSSTTKPHLAPALRDVASAVAPEPAKRDLRVRQHDSTVDARTAFLCAHFLLDHLDRLPYLVPRTPDPAKAGGNGLISLENKSAHLFVHRIPANFTDEQVKAAIEAASAVAVDSVLNFQPGSPYSKLTLAFRSDRHATLAFDALGSRYDDDKTGRPQKRLFLNASTKPPLVNEAIIPAKFGPYCKVRML